MSATKEVKMQKTSGRQTKFISVCQRSETSGATMFAAKSKIQCAVYVRKSTERGLDQEFNSLDNQELACKAYIASQAFQGWEYTKTYSDAAISGGTMARPGLKQMLKDIKAGSIQCVLVYKIDRFSRSIYDFKIMMKEVFEKHDCNLVSITQSFDTSTAMGKLTLNMLLSFAEFEREVASERVRDKMRATKSKGMWVGGVAPLGYDLQFGKLVPNQTEVQQVTQIYETYLESSGITECREKLVEMGITGKRWLTKKGEERGGQPMTNAILERVLKNQIYLGKLPNKSTNEVFDGQHPAIITKELFNKVQQKLTENNNHKDCSPARGAPILFQKVFLPDGRWLKNRTGKRNQRNYRYYKLDNVSLPAGDLENIVRDLIHKFLDSDMSKLPDATRLAFKQCEYSDELLKAMIDKIVYNEHKISIFIKIGNVDYLKEYQKSNWLNSASDIMDYYISTDQEYAVFETPVYLSNHTCINNRHGGCEVQLLTQSETTSMLIKALSYGWKYKKQYEAGVGIKEISKTAGRDQRTIYKYLNLSYLSPRIINTIMAGDVPANMNVQNLFQIASKYANFYDQELAFYAI